MKLWDISQKKTIICVSEKIVECEICGKKGKRKKGEEKERLVKDKAEEMSCWKNS